ncbi:MAG: hypothetical protein IKJ58_05905 [Akkermansia sp.]|nr:hypothetical protein [Akkermansia sp.]
MASIIREGSSKTIVVLRLVVAALLAFMCLFKLHITYRGLDQPAAMEQAQIARSLARGEGFETRVLRPINLMQVYGWGEMPNNETADLSRLKDTMYAPLNIVAMAVALKVTGYDDFSGTRMTDGYVYGADRVISSTSTLFFIIAIILAYMLIARLFDEMVACASSCFLIFSDLLLNYSVSGLPQPLMLCFMLAGMHMLLTAIKCYESSDSLWALLYVALAFFFLGLMVLTSWMGIWVVAGLLIYVCMRFRPMGAYAAVGGSVLLLLLAYSAVRNYQYTGSVFGNAFLGLYNSFGGGEELAMRSANLNNMPLQSQSFVLRFIGHTFAQLRGLYVNMGSILVVPFFFLALFNRFKRESVQSMKWGVFCMWVISCVGMALFGVNTPENPSQLAILFAPLFVAFGVSLVFNFLARINLEGTTFNQLRGLTMFLMVAVSAGPFIVTLPENIYRGIWLGDRGRPHFPPYYPPALNNSLVDVSSPDHVIVTDQPWAVAWYADRRALWIPTSVDDLVSIVEPALKESRLELQGILITPTSHTTVSNGVSGIVANMGDFAPLALEGKILQMVPRHNLALADYFVESVSANRQTMTLGNLVSSQGRFSNRIPLLGAEMIYYNQAEARN